jgi:hypothetical protein
MLLEDFRCGHFDFCCWLLSVGILISLCSEFWFFVVVWDFWVISERIPEKLGWCEILSQL